MPELFCFEVYSVLARLHPNPNDAFLQGIIPIVNSGILRSPMTERLANDAFLFVGKGLTGYDASYAALAYQLEGTWLTFDRKAHGNLQSFPQLSMDLGAVLPEIWK